MPVVKADDPKIIAAISAHANVTKDDVGSIQEVGPPGLVGPGEDNRPRAGFDPGKGPTDDDMKNIGKLNNLRRLILASTRLRTLGMVHLKNLTRLRELDLSETRIGDTSLQYLAGMQRLEALNLSGTDISDKGVKTLQGLKFPKAQVFPAGGCAAGSNSGPP